MSTIRFEDLGEPVKKLLRSLKGDVSDEDMTLLQLVSVKDMAKIYQEMGTERQAEAIWAELREALVARREKAERKAREMENRQEELQAEAAAHEEAEREQAAEEEEARRKRKEERRARRAAAQAAAEAEEEAEAARLQTEQEEAEAAAAAETARREAKAARRAEKARRVAEEQEALRREAAEIQREQKQDQRQMWNEHVANHPLAFGMASAPMSLEQKKKDEDASGGGLLSAPSRPQVAATAELLMRSYTAQCPNCHAKYSRPPAEWDCPMCLRKFRQRVKTWQPDCDNCVICKCGVGRFSRHHCRNCGRVVCGGCSEFKALIPALGYKDAPVKVCKQCMAQMAQ